MDKLKKYCKLGLGTMYGEVKMNLPVWIDILKVTQVVAKVSLLY